MKRRKATARLRRFNRLGVDALTLFSGGLRNLEDLKEYLNARKEDGAGEDDILFVVVFQQACEDSLDPVYDADGSFIDMDGAEDLWDFVYSYYEAV